MSMVRQDIVGTSVLSWFLLVLVLLLVRKLVVERLLWELRKLSRILALSRVLFLSVINLHLYYLTPVLIGVSYQMNLGLLLLVPLVR
jgi:hypothetical protein